MIPGFFFPLRVFRARLMCSFVTWEYVVLGKASQAELRGLGNALAGGISSPAAPKLKAQRADLRMGIVWRLRGLPLLG